MKSPVTCQDLLKLWLVCMLALISRFADASAVYAQPLQQWNVGGCSPCSLTTTHRAYASFSLGSETTLTSAEFALLLTAFTGNPDEFSVSIWNAGRDNQLYAQSFSPSDYDLLLVPGQTDSKRLASMALPGWVLGPGSYWISLFGTPGSDYLSWAGDTCVGIDPANHPDCVKDDLLLNLSASTSTQKYFGFTLYETATPPAEVPAPGTLGLLGIGLAALGLHRRRTPARA